MSKKLIHTNPALLFWICCLAFVANGLLSVLPGSSLSLLARDTDVSLSTASIVFSVASLGTIIAVIISNPFIQQIGARVILIAGLIGLITASLVIPTTSHFDIWLIAQFIQGSSASLLNIGLAMVMMLNFPEELGEKLNTLYGAYGIGALVAPILLSLSLAHTGSAVMAFLPISLLSGIAVLMLYLLEFRSKPDRQENPMQDSSRQVNELSVREIMQKSLLWLVVLQACLYTGTESGFSNWLVTSISRSSTISLQNATPAATFFWLGLTIGRLLLAQSMKHGWLQDQRLLYISFIGGGLFGTIVTIFINDPTIGFIGSLCEGLFIGPILPSVQAIATRRFHNAPTLISSAIFISTGLGGMVIPTSIGMLMPHLGIRGGMIIPACLCLLICIPSFLANRQERVIAAAA